MIKSAAVTEVTVPAKMMFPENGQGSRFGKEMLGAALAGAALGAIGTASGTNAFMAGQAIGGQINGNELGNVANEPLRAFLLGEIRSCFTRRLGETGVLSMTTSRPEGSISIDVFRWGFIEVGTPLAVLQKKKVIVTGWVTIEMVDFNGRVLWRREIDSLRIFSFKPKQLPLRDVGDYEKTPTLMKRDLAILADEIAKVAADELRSSRSQ